MATIQTMRIPCEKGQFREVNYRAAIFMVGGKRIKFAIQLNSDGTGKCVSHYASGYRIGDLNPVKVRHMVCVGTYGSRLNDREAAEIVISDIIAKIGPDAFLSKLETVPIINR